MLDSSRRLPIYLLIDCSSSMIGDPIVAVKNGMKTLLSELRSDPAAAQTAYMSIITFDNKARQITPLTHVMNASIPEISAGGSTSLGEALQVLIKCIKNEVRKSTDTQKGDWYPLVFILTDGVPTDTAVFDLAVQQIKSVKTAGIIACAAGSKASTDKLKSITENILVMNTISTGDMAKYFAWLSTAIQSTSSAIGVRGVNDALPFPQEGFVVVS